MVVKSLDDRKFIFLVNPISGTRNKGIIEDLIKRKAAENHATFEIEHTSPLGNYNFIKDKIATENITDIVLVGGDGTVNTVVAALRDQPVNFGIIPMGSGNGLALTAKIPTNPVKALDLIFNGQAIAIDAFKINDHFSCMLSGLGFDAQVAHDFANKASRGLLTYTQQSLFQYFKAQPYQFEVIIKELCFFTEAFFISIANSNQFGNNVTIAPQASLHDGLLDIVIVQKMNKAKLPFAVLKQIRGNNLLQELVADVSSKNILYFQTPSLTIRNRKYAPLHVDGEPMDTVEEYKIDILPGCFNLIQPV